MNTLTTRFNYGRHEVVLETGGLARQASGAVQARMGDTVVLVTVVAVEDKKDRGFFPLTIEYEERTYAAGRIPGGFFKREGRPSENAILTARLIDRPLRPLFPDGLNYEVQIIATVLSVDPEINPDIVAMIGASAALAVSGIPFNGPIGAARVGFIDDEFVLCPSKSELAKSRLNLIIAGTENAVLMVESEAAELSEAQMLEAVMFGHRASCDAIKAVRDLAAQAGAAPWDWQAPETDAGLVDRVRASAEAGLAAAYGEADKVTRQAALRAVHEQVMGEFCPEGDEVAAVQAEAVKSAVKQLEKTLVRERILSGQPRIDGRDTETVRPLHMQVGVLPRTHGSALFTRGETQALVVVTLGTERDSQIIDALDGDYRERFLFHYNFPPYSVGEAGRVGSPKRREIGHGALAKRGVKAVLPDMDDFPYTLRVVSEITESNGSSSMASVCGASLALMDAGVPSRTAVAGVAMGLIKEGDRHAVLTDILGDEDHLGDMDFKVAGTEAGVTALQMDIKIDGITEDIMRDALTQARAGRLHILSQMNEVIAEPRAEMSDYAPRIVKIKINPEKIRDVIGKGGSTIRALSEETGVNIDIDDDGTVKIASTDNMAAQEAIRRIEQITADVEVGTIYEGRVESIMNYGAFVNILPGRDGLVHISQISHERVSEVSDVLKKGDKVRVKVLDVDKQGHVRLSMKALEQKN